MGTSVPERIIEEVFGLLNDQTAGNPYYVAGLTTAVGRRATGEHRGAPAVVAIPLGSQSIDMTNMPGRQSYTNPDTNTVEEARRLLHREFNIQWECHGAPPADMVDFGPAERLFLATLRAIRQACHHSVGFSAEEWHDQQEGNDGFVKYGSLIKFTTTIQIPIFDTPFRIVYLTGTPQIVTTATLNGNQEGA